MEHSALIEAILFMKAEPVAIRELARLLECSEEDVAAAMDRLETSLGGRGIRLLRKDGSVLLGTAPEAATLLETITREELSRDLGKAGSETLAIVCYRGPVAKYEIDFIRGVNSGAILRSLLVRGLIEKISNPKDERGFLYRPSFELFEYLGITKASELPNFEIVRKELDAHFNDTASESTGQKGD